MTLQLGVSRKDIFGGTGIYCLQIKAGTGISSSDNQGLYPRPVAVLASKSDVPGNLY